MAFHYQNIIQEKEYNYPEFEEQYAIILKYTAKRLRDFKKSHPHPKMKDIWQLAARSCVKETHISPNELINFPRKQERLLIITNILFPDNESFLNTLKTFYNVDKETCEKLKFFINDLDKKDGDFLDSTMEGIIRYHLPVFDTIKDDLSLNVGDEFIIWKLMEIMYIHQDIFDKVYPKQKSL